MHRWLGGERGELLSRVEAATKLDDQLTGDMKAAIKEIKETYLRDNPEAKAGA